jgi:hypothetical protein
MTNDVLLDLARELNGRREPYALVTVVRAVAPTWRSPECLRSRSAAIASSPPSTAAAAMWSPWLEDRVGEPRLVRIQQRDPTGTHVEHTTCASNGTFIQLYSRERAS